METQLTVTTIIPTSAMPNRAESLKRAVRSIRSSSQNRIAIVVVVNGDRRDPGICRWLAQQNDIQADYLPEPSLPAAILRGRNLVNTPYFSLLDDDDEYLVGATDRRVQMLESTPAADLVITNGFRHRTGVDKINFPTLNGVVADPLAMVFKSIWLCSCNVLFRSSVIGASYFEDVHARGEWTWIAFNLAMDKKRIQVLDEPGFRIHDTPGSLSKTDEYQDAYIALFERMLARIPPRDIAQLIRRRISADWHDRSTRALARGDRRGAVQSHLRSLLCLSGLRYLSYSRRLIRGR